MPLYDCMLLLKPQLKKESVIELVSRVGKHVYRRNGVITDVKSHGIVQLGYGVKKLDRRYYQESSNENSNLVANMRTNESATRVIFRPNNEGEVFRLKGQMMQMTMMTPPSFNSELHYLNKEDRLLRWLLVKHRDIKFGGEFLSEDDGRSDLRMMRSSIYDINSEDEDDDDDDDEEEYNTEYQEEKKDA